jgi:hypothetical protein
MFYSNNKLKPTRNNKADNDKCIKCPDEVGIGPFVLDSLSATRLKIGALFCADGSKSVGILGVFELCINGDKVCTVG